MRVQVSREALMGGGVMGEMYLGDSLALADRLKGKYAGRVQCVYLDPPFFTGEAYSVRVRVGEREWRSGAGTLRLGAFSDKWTDKSQYLDAMRATQQLTSP